MKRKLIISLTAACILLSGCGKWLNVQPYDEISQDDLFSSPDGFEMLLNGIYIELNDEMLYGGALTVEMIEIMGGAYGMGSDDSVWGNYNDIADYRYDTDYWQTRLNETWNKAWALILNCNTLLENLESRQSLFNAEDFCIIKGEALALRAMLHFDMLRLFGPVYSRNPQAESIPYYTEYDGTAHPLKPANEIASLVLRDLAEARVLLSTDPIISEGVRLDGPGGGETDNFLYYRSLRLNYYAVSALLARVSLWTGDTDTALKYATEVIKAADRGVFPFVESSQISSSYTDDPDRILSSEVIFSLSHAHRATLFDDYFDPSRLPNYVFTMEGSLMSNCIFGGVTTGGSLYDYRYIASWRTTGSNRYFYKYADIASTGNIRNTMIPLIRLGEMYLIAAECAGGNTSSDLSADLSGGLSYINLLRSHRGVDPLPSLSREQLQYEYIRELYAEGQLFFMYKRMFTRVLRSYTASNNPQAADEIFVLPLPRSETEN